MLGRIGDSVGLGVLAGAIGVGAFREASSVERIDGLQSRGWASWQSAEIEEPPLTSSARKNVELSVSTAVPSSRSVALIESEFAEASTQESLVLLRELASLGTADALELLFRRLSRDPDAFGSEPIWMLLREIDDPRVYAFAKSQFERALAEGLSGSRFSTGYLKLIASHGGVEGSELLLTQLRSEGAVRAREAASAVEVVSDRSNPGAYLEMLLSPDGQNQYLIGRALASWRDPSVTDALFGLARSSELHRVYRHAILEGLGRNALGASDVDAIYSHYWSAGDDRDWVHSAFAGLEALQANRHVDPEHRYSETAAVLEHVLQTDHWANGVTFLMNHPEFRTQALKSALQALLPSLQGSNQAAKVKAALLRFP